jgi:hypothetical protein
VDAPGARVPHTTARGGTPRRTFIEARELPDLLAGALRGSDVALRRVLGARRGGRIGAALAALLALLAASDARAAVVGIAAYAGCSALVALRHRASGLGLYRALRLLLWTLPLPLVLAALARSAGLRSRLLLPAAVAIAWLLLERGLRGGRVGAPAQSADAAGGASGDRTSVGTGSPGRE